MICDTAFLIDLVRENDAARVGPALSFLAAHRQQPFLVTVISVGEFAAIYRSTMDARRALARWRQLRLTPEVALIAATVDHELMATGGRLGENDNWIAGFCRYYGQPLISRDAAFDRVRGLRRLAY